MNDNFYKQLIMESKAGYAYQKIICDKNGLPCDYEFIEVNLAFEKLTGLKGSDIIGKKITKVLPDIRKSEFDWIHFYGDVAINGDGKELEYFSESLQRWYRISISSPEKYYFITHFTDITKEMTLSSEMEKLLDISEEFLQINEQNIDYQKIADDFINICGGKYVGFYLFDEDGKSFTTMAVAGDKGMLKKISRMVNFKIVGKKWDYDPVRAEKIKNQTITHFHSLRELVRGSIPIPLAALIEKTFGIGDIVLIKILKKDVILGGFTLIMDKGKKFEKNNLAEIYTRQLGMVITRKEAEDNFKHEKSLTDAIFHSVPGMLYLYDDKGKLVRWNEKYQDLTGYSSEELSKINTSDCYKGDKKDYKVILKGISSAIKNGLGEGEIELQKKDGTTVPIYFTISSLCLDGKQYFAGVAIDITERKRREKEIIYLSYHDQLTGLYNRRFYQKELKRLDIETNLPITIVLGDVNGLKLINDSFGHDIGDELLKKVAKAIRSGCDTDDIIARLGGDEFVILLLKTDADKTEQIIKRINDLLLGEKVGSIDISISFGYEIKHSKEEKFEAILKKAEAHMYKNKLFENPSLTGKTINTIISTLHEKNKREEQHSHRVSVLCKSMGVVLGLPDYKNEELKSVGLLHDIGKIAIDESVLNKPGKLSEGEWKEIKRHPEIGYRILNTVNDMSEMSQYVLAHHERWDGTGYPKGLKGHEIPFESRIIAIADAYDAMTSERSYRTAMPEKVVIDELRKNSGIQFDPKLVSIFIKGVLGKV